MSSGARPNAAERRRVRVSGNRRVVLAALCVEAVAAASVAAYGYLAIVAVAVLYWIDLLFLMCRVSVQRLLARRTRGVDPVRILFPFRLLKHKRGTVSLTDRLPPLHPKNVPVAVTTLWWGTPISVSTVSVAALSVPGAFWRNAATPFLFAAGAVTAAAKSWLLLREHVATGAYERQSPVAVNPWKRQALFVLYGGVLYVAADFAAALVAENGIENTRSGIMAVALLVVGLRLAYAVRVSHTRFGNAEAGSPDSGARSPGDDRVISWFRSKSAGEGTAVLAPPSTPDGTPLETVTPASRSVDAAGVLNALVAGLAVDEQISSAGLSLRVCLLFMILFSLVALLGGGVGFFLVVSGFVVALLAVIATLSIGHLRLALGGVEYRFYDDELVVYDNAIGEPQWAVPYDCIRDVSVERGAFGSPLWLDAGTVSFERVDNPPEDDLADREPRSSLPFVSDPERVVEEIQSRGGQ